MATALIRTFIIYAILTATLRLMGKRQIGELEISELVSTLLLSELASAAIGDPSVPMTFSIFAILLIVALEFLISNVKNRSPFLKKLFDGTPSILVRRGEIDQKELKRMRISVEELFSAFRLQGIGTPEDVYYAVLEQNGQLSVILRADKAPLSASDARGKVTERGMAHALIVDGEISKKALDSAKKSEEWLKRICAKKNLTVSDVFLLTVNDNEDIYIINKEGNE